MRNWMKQYKKPVILSERSESKDLRIFDSAEQYFGAKIPPRASLGRDDKGRFLIPN